MVQMSTVSTGLEDIYHLILHEEPSAITIHDITMLDIPHADSFLQHLNLDDNQIGDSGATALGEGLKGNWMLKRLSIKRNRIARDGGNALGLGLQQNHVLKEVYLTSNVIGDDGILELCHALSQKGCVLTLVDLGSNQLSYVASRLLARALIDGNSLQSLLLKNNMVGGDGAGLLEQGIRHSSSLTYLNLERNILGDIGMGCLMRALRRIPPMKGRKAQPDNRSLVGIDVSTNNLSDGCIGNIEESLFKNLALRSITAHDNVISEKGLIKIQQLLAANKRRAELVKCAIMIQSLWRGRQHRLARVRAAGQVVEERVFKPPATGDRVQVDGLPGNLKRYNGQLGEIESIEFDTEHRQWVNIKLDDTVRTLPIRCPKKCITVQALETPAEPTPEPAALPAETETIELTAGAAIDESLSTHDLDADHVGTPCSGASGASRVSGLSGMSDLAQESGPLLTRLTGSYADDFASSMLHVESPVAAALLQKLALQEWPASPSRRPHTLHDKIGTDIDDLEPAPINLERPRTYGGKSVKEQDLMLTAARLTLVNMGDALMQQQAAAEEMAREAGCKCMDAAEHYASLEEHLKAVILDEDTSEEDVKIALQALNEAEQAALKTMEEAEEAEQATLRAFRAMADFEQFEHEESAFEKAVSGLHGLEDNDDDDIANQLTDRASMSIISEGSRSESALESARSAASHQSMGSVDETGVALEQSASAGASVSDYYRRLRSVLEDDTADEESIEAAVADFNHTQDEALFAFDSAIKALEDETSNLEFYQEDSRTFVDSVRQEMVEAYQVLQAAQEAEDGDDADFEQALADFSAKSAHISQLVVRAEVFRLGSSWSQSSSRRPSPGRNVAVHQEVQVRLRNMCEYAITTNISCLSEEIGTDEYYTTKEESATLRIQALMRGGRVRSKFKLGAGSRVARIMNETGFSHHFEKKYTEDEMNSILKIQCLARGGLDRQKVNIAKRMGKLSVNEKFLLFLSKQPEDVTRRMQNTAVKIQSRVRGGQERRRHVKRKAAADALRSMTGTDLLSSSLNARLGRHELASQLVGKTGYDAGEQMRKEELAQKELAAVIIQKRMRGMQARSIKDLAPGASVKSLFMVQDEIDQEDIQNSVRGNQTREKTSKKGFFSSIGERIEKVGQNLSKAFTANDGDANSEFHEEVVEQAKEQKHRLLERNGSRNSLVEAELDAMDLNNDASSMSTDERMELEANQEAKLLLGDIKKQALAELEAEMAMGAGLMANFEFEDEYISLPTNGSLSKVSFPTLKEFKGLQFRQKMEHDIGSNQDTGPTLCLEMSGNDLLNLDGVMDKSDPYLIFARINRDGTRHEVRRSSIIKDNLNPSWPKMRLDMGLLCLNKSDALFRIECWGSDASLFDPLKVDEDDLIGWVDTSLDQLFLQQPLHLQYATAEYQKQGLAKRGQNTAKAVTAATAAATVVVTESAIGMVSSGAGLLSKVGGDTLMKIGGIGGEQLKKVGKMGGDGLIKAFELGGGAVGNIANVGSSALGKVAGMTNNLSLVSNINFPKSPGTLVASKISIRQQATDPLSQSFSLPVSREIKTGIAAQTNMAIPEPQNSVADESQEAETQIVDEKEVLKALYKNMSLKSVPTSRPGDRSSVMRQKAKTMSPMSPMHRSSSHEKVPEPDETSFLRSILVQDDKPDAHGAATSPGFVSGEHRNPHFSTVDSTLENGGAEEAGVAGEQWEKATEKEERAKE